MNKKSGFTLAEVLITLGIIGVVAAMTIPTLLNTTNDQEYKAAFKKALSAVNQAVTMNVALEGTDFATMTTATLQQMFQDRLNVVSSASGVVAGMAGPVAGNITFFLNDGIAISFPATADECTSTAKCNMLIDVNGTKKPNTLITTATTNGLAKDQYNVQFFNQQVVPSDTSAKYVLFN